MDLAALWLTAQLDKPSAPSLPELLTLPLPAGLRLLSPSSNQKRLPSLDDLWSKGKFYQQRKEERQHNAALENLRATVGNRQKPSLASVDHMVERLYERDTRRRETKAIGRRKWQQEKEANLSFTPSLSKKGYASVGKVMDENFSADWHHRKREWIESERNHAISVELGKVRRTPTINPRSKQLAEARRARSAHSRMSYIDEMLERDAVQRAVHCRRHQMDVANAKPKITLLAASLERREDASERLYWDAFTTDRRQHRIRDTATERHTPEVSDLARRLDRNGRVEDNLLQRFHSTQLMQRVREVDEQRAEARLHCPVIAKASSAIASCLSQSSQDRLYAPRPQRITSNEAVGLGSPDLTLRSGASQIREREHLAVMELFERRRQERLRTLRDERDELEVRECTFVPVGSHRAGEVAGSFLEREAQWESRRLRRQERLRKEQNEESVKDYTIVPLRTSPPIVEHVPTPPGVTDHIARHSEARKQEAERQSYFERRTENWERRVTRPVPFSFTERQREGIPSVEPPVRPCRTMHLSLSPSLELSTLSGEWSP